MKRKYLLDTCICIHFLQNRPEVVKKLTEVGWENCCIAEATIGELLCGIRDDGRKARNVNIIESFVQILMLSLRDLPFVNMQNRNAFYNPKEGL